MAALHLPARRKHNSQRAQDNRSYPGHRAWVRGHGCCVPGCSNTDIECAHVRQSNDGGVGLKPSDRYTISLCRTHDAEQHRTGEPAFERRYRIELVTLAERFATRSPHRWRRKS